MSLYVAIRQFFDAPAGQAVVALLALAFLDFLLGAFAAFRDGTFRLDAVAAWVRKHIAGRVLPIATVLILGHILGGVSVEGASAQPIGVIVSAIGLAAAAVYVLEIVGSIRESLTPKGPLDNVDEVRRTPTD